MKRRQSTSVPREAPDGVAFPITDGRRATQPVGRAVVSAASVRVDTAACEAARAEPMWHKRYIDHFRELTRLAAGANAGLIATDGLAELHDSMRFRRRGSETSILEAMATPRAGAFTSLTVSGSGPVSDAGLVLYDDDTPCRGTELLALLDRWDQQELGEPSATRALRLTAGQPEWLDLRGVTVVALGAAAELSPVPALLSWGCHVVAIDLPGKGAWRTLIDHARRSPGRLTVPVRASTSTGLTDSDHGAASVAGADITIDAPEIADWLTQLDETFVLGDYAYAPGASHLRVAAAVDAIVATVLSHRDDVGLAYLATPTDSYAVPAETVAVSETSFAQGSRLVAMARGLGGSRLFRANYEHTHALVTGRRFGVFDGLIEQQGANYALAKRVQRWRAQVARDHGQWVSINVAPATRTASVISNRLLEAAYRGSDRFGLRVFTPLATRQAMAALLVHDLRNAGSVAHPHLHLEDALDLLATEALHGGMWRAPYSPRSVLGLAAATGRFTR